MTVIKLYVVCFFALFPFAVSSANAQDVSEFYSPWASERDQVNLRKQAACATKKYPAAVERIVLDDLEITDIYSLEPDIMEPCYSASLFKDNRVAMAHPVYNWAIAEALILLDEAPTRDLTISKAAPLEREAIVRNMDALPQWARDTLAVYNEFLKIETISECTVRKATSASYDLVFAKPLSKAEEAAFAAIRPTIQGCMEEDTATSPPDFFWRGAIASNIFRLSRSRAQGSNPIGISD